jgi:hypothetical protein
MHFESSLGLLLPTVKSNSLFKLKAGTAATNTDETCFEDYNFDSDEILSRSVSNNRGRLVPQSLSVDRKSSFLSFLVYKRGSLNVLKALFLPVGYPNTTPFEYSEFQM